MKHLLILSVLALSACASFNERSTNVVAWDDMRYTNASAYSDSSVITSGPTSY